MALPVAFIGLGTVIGIVTIAAVLIARGRLSSNLALLLLAVTILVPGLLLGGLPDPVLPLQQIAHGVSGGAINPAWIAGIAVLLIMTLIAGRLFCGYACPLGAVQELLARLTKKKLKINAKAARAIRLAVLIIFIGAGAIAVVYQPIDPLAVFSLRPSLPQLGIFAAIAATAVFVYRPWCTLLCPFGALADIASAASPFRLRADAKCNDCGVCDRVCPAGQSVRKGDLSNCYYCGRCISKCPKKAIYAGLKHAPAVEAGEAAKVTVK